MIKIDRPSCPHPQALIAENYKHPLNKTALHNANYGKCMYCEGKISHVDYGDIEHIKPKKEGLFPELKFEWSNLGYSCSICNNNKKDFYDFDAPIINPYSEMPSEHLFAFGSLLKHRNGSERGEITINQIQLNRPQLIERRMARLDSVLSALDACHRAKSARVRQLGIEALKAEAENDSEFSAFVKALIDAHNGADTRIPQGPPADGVTTL